ncbi:MAG: HEAT repeat domain-containing protein [Candidatus Omnitrophota bacterium]|nr:HEAT repeat domain-containing protein [Candidatus Omnitrophota bacterium]
MKNIIAICAACGIGILAVSAQPILPKNKIPFGIGPGIRQNIENLYQESAEARAAAIIKLGDMKEKAAVAVPFLVEMLSDSGSLKPYGMVSTKAAEALVKIGAPSVEPLIGVLKNSRERVVRSAAASALGQLHDARAIEPLIESFRGEDSLFRLYVAEALGQIGKPAIGSLSVLLENRNEIMREAATVSLGQIAMFKRDTRAAEYLLISLRDDDVAVRRQAAVALYNISGWYKMPAAIDAAIVALEDADAEVASYCALSLGASGAYQAINPLIKALGRKGNVESAQGFMNFDVYENAVNALTKIGKPAASVLRDALHDRDRYTRQGAATVLGRIKDLYAIEPLIGALGDTEEGVRLASRDALITIGVPATWPIIVAFRSAEGPAQQLIAGILTKITGENLGLDQAKWYDWYQRRNN